RRKESKPQRSCDRIRAFTFSKASRIQSRLQTLRLKTRSGTSEVITEPDDLGTPGLAQRKAAKPRKRKDKGTRGKQSKQKTQKKPKHENDKTEERTVQPS